MSFVTIATQAWEIDNGFLTPKTVAGFYKSLDKSKRTIAYCQTGTRSTLTYLELRLLGFKDPANWDDSWRVYSSDLSPFPNIVCDRGRSGAMSERIIWLLLENCTRPESRFLPDSSLETTMIPWTSSRERSSSFYRPTSSAFKRPG